MESFDKVINWFFITIPYISIKTSFYQNKNNWQRMLKAYSCIARQQFTTQDNAMFGSACIGMIAAKEDMHQNTLIRFAKKS